MEKYAKKHKKVTLFSTYIINSDINDYKVDIGLDCLQISLVILTLKDPSISESCIEVEMELNFYFHTSFWCLKRFYEGL